MPEVFRITMPEWPQLAQSGPQKALSPWRNVSVFLEGTGKLWIHGGDLEWLIRSLFIYRQLKGVDDVASDDEGPDATEKGEPDMTPEKIQQPIEAAGNIYEKWGEPP